jgi:hypothetical protein
VGTLDIFTHDFPYTDNHELNLSWVIKKIQELNVNLETLEERVKQASIEASKEYVDFRLEEVFAEFNALSQEVADLHRYFDEQVATLQGNYNAFTNSVQQQIVLLTNRINAFDQIIKNDIIGVNALTDLKIQQNNEYILNEVAKGVVNVKVINFFTGERITVQEMFDFLASLHATDTPTIQEMIDTNKTVQQFIDIGHTVGDWVRYGKQYIS